MKSLNGRVGLCARHFLLVAIAATALLQAQQTGEIRLEVKDSSGAAVRASGKLLGASGGSATSFETDIQGRYTAVNLTPGAYRLEVTKAGFATQSVRLDVVSGKPFVRTITLELSSQASSISVVSSTPLPGSDLSRDQIPSAIQTASAKDLEESGSPDLSDFLNKHFDGVYINENQGNPFQPDLNYRGYTASPLLGTPEGISVYLDGVRQNQPLGDVVGWDLIPKIAISEAALMPGSNPVFGLNTLGGAVSLQTKDGFSAPGGSVQISGGSFGRVTDSAEYGGSTKSGFNYYVAGTLFNEDGWRKFSPSKVRQGFAKLGQRWGKGYLSLSLSYADNTLAGNGVQDGRWLAQDYTSVYTITDKNWNRSPAVTLNAAHQANRTLTVSGNAFFRYVRTDSINPNLNGNSFDESVYQPSAADIAALKAAGYTGYPASGANTSNTPFPFWRCIGQALTQNEPLEKCDATTTRGWTHEHNYGFSGQALWKTRRNNLIVGAAWNGSGVTFQQSTQFGYLNPDRISITSVPFFADGSSNSNGTPVDSRVNLHGTVNTPSFYVADTLSAGRWTLAVSGRYNHERLHNFDRIPGAILGGNGTNGGRGSLNGDYTFQRFNPSVGLTFNTGKFVTLYFNYSEANRAPTTMELGCADPNYPCNLPNALVSDPPLNQVVTRTFEGGARSVTEGKLRWSADYFFSQNYNDLLFVSSATTGLGYFTNFGKTRRDGLEFSLSETFSKWHVGGNYTFQNVTYQSPQTINGGANSSADGGPGLGGDISIVPGNYIPQSPRNIGKAFLDFRPTARAFVGLNLVGVGRSFARGNENNQDQLLAPYYLGPGYSAGYVVANLSARYRLHKRVEAFVQVNNLLNHRYYTGAQLGTTPFDNSYNFIARPFPAVSGNYPLRSSTFFAPGTPIGVWGGLKYTF